MAGSSDRASLLLQRLEVLKAEVARKNEILRQQRTLSTMEPSRNETSSPRDKVIHILRDISSMTKVDLTLKTPASPYPILNDIVEEEEASFEDYPALRDVAVRASSVLEQEARKVVLGWRLTSTDDEARLSLLMCLTQPMEALVASLMAAATSLKITSVLRISCTSRATEACVSCINLLQGIETTKAPSLCGVVESVCDAIRKLPVSNTAAVKRQILEAARAIADTTREFESLKESGRMDWNLEEEGEEEEQTSEHDDDEEESIDEMDDSRLDAACTALTNCKGFLLTVADALKDDLSFLETISSDVKDVQRYCTDFGVELYPPQDVPRLIQNATLLLNACTKLCTTFAGERPITAFEEFKNHLSIVIV